nr:hypothetical protein CFP56_41740 [Quercus suber]POE89142.1 hypothetical protein CFP56_78786 [Quercus suber]
MSDQFSVTISVSKRIVGSERLIGVPNSLADRTQSVAREISAELSSSSSSKHEILKKKEKLIGFAELR